MKCPICNVELKKTKKFNVEVDYCPECRGIWFDKGEIKKISDGVEKFNFPEPDTSKLSIATTHEKSFPCPVCSAKMVKYTDKTNKTIFDACIKGHGYWFEDMEFEQYVRDNLSFNQ